MGDNLMHVVIGSIAVDHDAIVPAAFVKIRFLE